MSCWSSATAAAMALVIASPESVLGQSDNATVPSRSLRGSSYSCVARNALCGSHGERTAECCSGLTCEPMLGSFDMRCVDTPPPARDTCKIIGCGSAGEPSDPCECIEECLLRGSCCEDFESTCKSNAPTPAPTLPPSMPTPGPTFSPNTPAPTQASGLEYYWMFDSSYCMSVDGNEFRNGQKMQLWKCSGSSGQYFDYSQGLLKVAASPEYCVVIDGNKNENGARIQLWTCDASNNEQQWILDSPPLIRNAAFPDKCLVVDSNRGANGQQLQLWSCDGDEQYKTWGHAV